MANLTSPVTKAQLLDLVRQLSPDDRRALLDSLLAERFDATMSASDRSRAAQPQLTDDEIQAEVDAVRERRRQERGRAVGG